jgi:hypothetical protein
VGPHPSHPGGCRLCMVVVGLVGNHRKRPQVCHVLSKTQPQYPVDFLAFETSASPWFYTSSNCYLSIIFHQFISDLWVKSPLFMVKLPGEETTFYAPPCTRRTTSPPPGSGWFVGFNTKMLVEGDLVPSAMDYNNVDHVDGYKCC